MTTIAKRSGGAYDPRMVERFCAQAPTILAGVQDEPSWDAVLNMEPGGHRPLTDHEFDRACEAIADFADIKSTYTLGHSSGVATLAAGAGARCGLPNADVVALRRAGLLHDIGRVGISAGIWTKEATLSEREREQIRLHSYYVDRVLARPEPLKRLGEVASRHHERMDGSGYHRAVQGNSLSPAARIPAADTYHAMLEARPHRGALRPDEAAAEVRREVHPRPTRRPERGGGPRGGRAPRLFRTTGSSRWSESARDRDLAPAGARSVEPGDGRAPHHLPGHGQASRAARLQQDRCLDPCGRHAVCHGAVAALSGAIRPTK